MKLRRRKKTQERSLPTRDQEITNPFRGMECERIVEEPRRRRVIGTEEKRGYIKSYSTQDQGGKGEGVLTGVVVSAII